MKAGKRFPEQRSTNYMAFYGLPGKLCASWADDYLSCRPRNYFVATGRDLLRHVTVNHTGELRLFRISEEEKRAARIASSNVTSEVRRASSKSIRSILQSLRAS